MSLRFGTDGIRGEAFTELTTDLVEHLGRAAATVLGGGRWLVARDPRESGEALERAVVDGLTSAGAYPLALGVLPTPALAWLSAEHGAPAAMVTASHNPWSDNGVKIFAAGGLKLTDDVERAIEAALHADTLPAGGTAESERRVGLDLDHRTACDTYARHLIHHAGRLDGLRIALDCANGAMSELAPPVVHELGADVIVVHARPDGRNINDRCGATHTAQLQSAVVEHEADLGLAFDGDGDRVIAVDHLGRVVDGDRLLALAAIDLKSCGRLRHDTVVVTVMSNLGLHRAMARAGVQVVTTAVGDRSVLEALDDGGYSLGGEQSGHLVYRDLATTGDGLLAALQLAALVQRHARGDGRRLADLAGNVMVRYPQVLVNVRVDDRERRRDAASLLAAEIAAAESALGDDGRVLLRASGTEPLVRVMVEAADEATAEHTAASLAAAVTDRLG